MLCYSKVFYQEGQAHWYVVSQQGLAFPGAQEA